MSQEKDRLFFRNFSLVVALLAVMLMAFFAVAVMVGSDPQADIQRRAADVREMTQPVGQVSMEGEAMEATEPPAQETAATEPLSGKNIYNQLCVACHGVEGIGAPVLGNIEQWAPRIGKGMEELYLNAINGYTGPEGYMMPARGGGSYTDEEVMAAVDYMVENSQ